MDLSSSFISFIALFSSDVFVSLTYQGDKMSLEMLPLLKLYLTDINYSSSDWYNSLMKSSSLGLFFVGGVVDY